MESKHHDSDANYKKLEAEMNKSIHAWTNCRTFTKAFGRAMNAHLKWARIHRRLTTRWLKRLDFANKDEYAEISVRLVDLEDRLDFLDETIYEISKIQRENLLRLIEVRKLWKECCSVYKAEMKDIRDSKIKTLEKELADLQQFFEMESAKEGE